MKKVVFLTACVLLLLFSSAKATDEIINNEAVIALCKAGVPEQVIINKINASSVEFDDSIEALTKLAQAGVPGAIIEALQNRAQQLSGTVINQSASLGQEEVALPATLPENTGVYLVEGDSYKPVPRERVRQNIKKTSVAKTYFGLFGRVKAPNYLKGRHASVSTSSLRPKLLVFLPQYDINNLKLVRARVRKNKRELFNYEKGFFGEGLDGDEIPITIKKLTDDYYEIVPQQDLPSHEYALVDYGQEGEEVLAWGFGVENTVASR